MSLAYYTMDDLRLGRGGFLQKGWTIRQLSLIHISEPTRRS